MRGGLHLAIRRRNVLLDVGCRPPARPIRAYEINGEYLSLSRNFPLLAFAFLDSIRLCWLFPRISATRSVMSCHEIFEALKVLVAVQEPRARLQDTCISFRKQETSQCKP